MSKSNHSRDPSQKHVAPNEYCLKNNLLGCQRDSKSQKHRLNLKRIFQIEKRYHSNTNSIKSQVIEDTLKNQKPNISLEQEYLQYLLSRIDDVKREIDDITFDRKAQQQYIEQNQNNLDVFIWQNNYQAANLYSEQIKQSNKKIMYLDTKIQRFREKHQQLMKQLIALKMKK